MIATPFTYGSLDGFWHARLREPYPEELERSRYLAFFAESDRMLATMTHMLTSSSRTLGKNFEDRVTEKPRELVARIAVTEQSKHNNINQG